MSGGFLTARKGAIDFKILLTKPTAPLASFCRKWSRFRWCIVGPVCKICQHVLLIGLVLGQRHGDDRWHLDVGTLACFLTFVFRRPSVDELDEPRDSKLLAAFFIGIDFPT